MLGGIRCPYHFHISIPKLRTRALVKISPFTRALYIWFLYLILVAIPFTPSDTLGQGVLSTSRNLKSSLQGACTHTYTNKKQS